MVEAIDGEGGGGGFVGTLGMVTEATVGFRCEGSCEIRKLGGRDSLPVAIS